MSARRSYHNDSLRGSARRAHRSRISDINMVPFIDVMLVLLIIFMVTAPLIATSVVELPSVGRSSAPPDVVQTVSVRADESLSLRRSASVGVGASMDASAGVARSNSASGLDQIYAASQLPQLLQTLNVQQPVVIAADKSVRYEAVMRLMDALKTAGVQRVALAVEPVSR